MKENVSNDKEVYYQGGQSCNPVLL